MTFQIRFLTAATLAGPSLSTAALGSMALSAVAWICATCHIYLLNGVCDRTEDRWNESARPLAAGLLPVATARRAVRALAVLALVFSAVVSWRQAVLTSVMLVLGWLYSAGPRPAKASVPGSMAVIIAGGALTYLAGWQAAGGMRPSHDFTVLMVSMSLWMGLVGLTKDLSDVVGDRAAGRRTLPILLGDRVARRVLAVNALALGLLATVLTCWYAESFGPAVGTLLCGAVGVATTLSPRLSTGSRARTRLPYRIFFLTQYAVHLIVLAR